MQYEKYIACINASTTRSFCLLLSLEDHSVYSISLGRGLNPLEYSYQDFFYNLRNLVNSVLDKLNYKFGKSVANIEIEMLSISMEGIHFESDRNYVINCIHDLPISPSLDSKIYFVSRGLSCLLAEKNKPTGSLIKVGTSAFAYCAYIPQGSFNLVDKRIGGWGIFSGYDGGAYDIGRFALYRLFDEYEKREQTTDFPKLLFDLINVRNYDDLTKYIRTAALSGQLRQSISEIAKPIILLAETSYDKISIDFIIASADRITNSYLELINSLDFSAQQLIIDEPIILHGGIIQNSSIICRCITNSILNYFPNIKFKLLEKRAIVGNLRYCLKHIDFNDDIIDSIIDRIYNCEPNLRISYGAKFIKILEALNG